MSENWFMAFNSFVIDFALVLVPLLVFGHIFLSQKLVLINLNVIFPEKIC